MFHTKSSLWLLSGCVCFTVLALRCARDFAADKCTTPSVLSFTEPAPADDTVMIDEWYSDSIRGSSTSPEDSLRLFFPSAPHGFSYDPARKTVTWKADKNIVSAGSDPVRITAALTNNTDTVYHSWRLFFSSHAWKYLGRDDRQLEIAAYDSNLVFKLGEVWDSSSNHYGFYSGYILRSRDGAVTWEKERLINVFLTRFFISTQFSFEGLRQMKIFGNNIYACYHIKYGFTGPPSYESWKLFAIPANAGPLTEPEWCFGNTANDCYDYHVTPVNRRLYQQSSSVSPTMTFASSQILCDTTSELYLNQSSGSCITGPRKSDAMWASFYRYGIYRKTPGRNQWQNVCQADFDKITAASDFGDTLYFLIRDSLICYAVDANTSPQLRLQEAGVMKNAADLVMINGRTGWLLTRNGELYFTNNMFSTVTPEHPRVNGEDVAISCIIKAYNDGHIFAVGANKELFRY